MTAIINPPPRFAGVTLTNGAINLVITNLTSYLTNIVERAFDVESPGAWTTMGTFTGQEGATNWTETPNSDWTRATYRLRVY
jgi:hypothetical protein